MRSERYDTPEPIRLSLEVPAGRVRVASGDEPETTIDVEPAHDDEASREAAAQTRIEFGRGELSVVVPEQRSFGLARGRRAAVLVRVTTPSGATAVIIDPLRRRRGPRPLRPCADQQHLRRHRDRRG